MNDPATGGALELLAGSTSTAGYILPGGPTGCLMIHGWSGHPGELRPMAEYLHSQGLTVHVPQLAGHGTTPDDMAQSSYSDWIASAEAAWEALRRDHPASCIVGFSMGGTLALELAARRPAEATCVVTLGALTYLGRGWQSAALPLGRYLIKWYYPFSRKTLGNPTMRRRIASQVPGLMLEVNTPEDLERVREMTKVSIGAAYQLQLLTRAVRRRLPLVRVPLLIMHGRLDRVVNPRCASDIYARVGSAEKQLVWLKRSRHLLPLDVERQEVWQRTAAFIAAHAGREQSARPSAQVSYPFWHGWP